MGLVDEIRNIDCSTFIEKLESGKTETNRLFLIIIKMIHQKLAESERFKENTFARVPLSQS